MGKREEKKQELKSKILEGAALAFDEWGFEEATMERIAQKAGVAAGTAYNYFKSKEELYLLVMAGQLSRIQGSVEEREFTDLPAGEIVYRIIKRYIAPFGKIPRAIWKTMLGAAFSTMRKNREVFSTLVNADLKAMEQIGQLLEGLKNTGKISEETDTTLLVEIIYGALFMQLMMFIYTDNLTFEEACERFRLSILHIL